MTALDTGESTFYTTVSYENLDQIDADVILTQAEQQSALDEFLGSDRGQLIPAVKKGAVAAVVGEENVVGDHPDRAVAARGCCRRSPSSSPTRRRRAELTRRPPAGPGLRHETRRDTAHFAMSRRVRGVVDADAARQAPLVAVDLAHDRPRDRG